MLAQLEESETKLYKCCPKVVPAGMVSVDWFLNEGESPPSLLQSTPIVIIVPGLTGSSESGYVRRTACRLKREYGDKIRVAAYNPRSRGGNIVGSPFMYSAGYTLDLRRVIRHLKSTSGEGTRMIGISYSLGSNVLAKYMGEEGDHNDLDGAMCFATPLDLLLCCRALKDTYQGRLMDPVLCNFVQIVRQDLEFLLKQYPEKFDLDRIRGAKTMFDFDDSVVAPMFEIGGASGRMTPARGDILSILFTLYSFGISFSVLMYFYVLQYL